MVDMLQEPIERTARIGHICDWCRETINPKEKYMHYVCKFNGELQDTKMHHECYEAMEREQKEDPWNDEEFTGGPRGMTEWERQVKLDEEKYKGE